jgi:hypothetical protein
MPFVLMPNNQKTFVHEQEYPYSEISFSQLLSDVTDNTLSLSKRLGAIRLIGGLGVRGEQAIPVLENTLTKTFPATDYRISQAITLALNTIKNSLKENQPNDINTKHKKVDIIQVNGNLYENARITKKCSFCEKETILHPESNRLTTKLCSPGRFYCTFCLRNQLHMKDNKHVLMITFRSIIGYYFYEFYQFPKNPVMYLSEIQDYVNLHQSIGLLNPAFNYDPESFVWFIDFRRVGMSKKKISVSDVSSTIIDILASFNLADHIRNIQMHKLYLKYQEAISDFYEKRYRPEGKKLCSPTLKGCGSIDWYGTVQVMQNAQQSRMNIEDTKNFLPSMIAPEKYWQKTVSYS